MNCSKCGEVCGCPMEPPPTTLPVPDPASAIETVVAAGLPADALVEESSNSAWRDELTARLTRYRSRRKAPPPRYPSLKLPFDAIGSPARAVETSSARGFEPASNHALALDGMVQEASPAEESPALPQPEIANEVAAPVRRAAGQASAKIIEFPRFAWGPPPPPPDQLAEPVGDRPRILEVPDVEAPLPALGGITIEPVEAVEVEKLPGIDIPLQSAPLGLRFLAAIVDGIIIATASGLFGFIFWKVTAVRPPQLQLLALAGGVLCLFWAAYNYLLVVYSGSTPGLRVAGLRLTKFDGSSTSRALRRWRVLASFLSAVSLGMGFAWVFLDEDALCWHDRITHTYLAPVHQWT
jgi:uncharacterized RDD family membrane protein YckC